MIASMTGYGKADCVNDKVRLTVEIKSVNSKQLDLSLRLPSIFRQVELPLRNKLAPLFERGKIELSVNCEFLKENAPVKFNTTVIADYKKQLEEIAGSLHIGAPTDWLTTLIRLPESITSNNPEADADEISMLFDTAVEAAQNFRDSRIKEGKGLYEFFFEKIERIREYLQHTEKFETERVTKIREKLEQQLSKLQGIEIDRGRLEQEMIF